MPETPERSRPLRLKVWGPNACFTRPEMKVERVSYDVMTPSAARGIFEAILWKPALRWRVFQIDVLKPIQWESVRRNEVGCVMSPRTKGFFIEDHRQQRAGLFLRDVAYIIHACLELTDKAGPEDGITKFEQMFLRRAEKGQCFTQPYLGCREFAASFEPLTFDQPLPEPIAQDSDLGWILHDLDFGQDKPQPHFFRASLEQGRLAIPFFENVGVRA